MENSSAKRFTLGMCVHDDLDGVYFSCQGNRLLHPIIDQCGEILIIDNQPRSAHGKETKKFVDSAGPTLRYVPYADKRSTSIRNKIFEYANSPIVICIDSHVLLPSGAIEAVLKFLEEPKNCISPILVQGPLYNDSLDVLYSHWNDLWINGMQGQWQLDTRANDPNGAPYEISAQGLGCFACRKSLWPGFNDNFRGFGGEELYIHKKFRSLGGQCISIPAFRWVHRFHRVKRPKYIDGVSNRLFNYLIGALELEEDVTPILEYFRAYLSEKQLIKTFKKALSTLG